MRTIRNDFSDQLETVKYTCNGFLRWKNIENINILDNKLITKDFKSLYKECIQPAETTFEMTLRSFANQSFKDFEVLIVHRHPEYINKEVLKKYKDKVDFKIIKSKHTIWNDLGEEYSDFVNNGNTGAIWADGELLHFINDSTLYPSDFTKELWRLYKGNKLGIPARTFYCYLPNYKPKKPLKNNYNQYDLYEDPIYADISYPNPFKEYYKRAWMWGYGISTPLNEFLEVNGFDETLDGWMGTDDGDYERRVMQISQYEPILMKNMMYSLVHAPKHFKDIMADHGIHVANYRLFNEKLMETIGQRPRPTKYIKANLQRPTREDMDKVKEWFDNKYGEGVLDKNYDTHIKLPTYDLTNLRKVKNKEEELCGKLITI